MIKENQQDKYENDLEYKLLKRYQSRLDNYFDGKRIYDAKDVLGCTIPFFVKFIEFQIKELKLPEDLKGYDLSHIKPIKKITRFQLD